MDSVNFLRSCIVALLVVIDVAQSAPAEYCFHKLNTSDCGFPATPVAYYYKPGSRCEIAIWRGCPTFNKFDDEVICSHHCIARMVMGGDDNNLETLAHKEVPVKGKEEPDDLEDWEDELEDMSQKDLEAMDNILNNALNTENKPKRNKLKLEIDTKSEATTLNTKVTTKVSSKTLQDSTTISNPDSTTEKVSTTEVNPETNATKEAVATTEATTEATTSPKTYTTTETTTTESTTQVVTVATTDKDIGDADEVIIP